MRTEQVISPRRTPSRSRLVKTMDASLAGSHPGALIDLGGPIGRRGPVSAFKTAGFPWAADVRPQRQTECLEVVRGIEEFRFFDVTLPHDRFQVFAVQCECDLTLPGSAGSRFEAESECTGTRGALPFSAVVSGNPGTRPRI